MLNAFTIDLEDWAQAVVSPDCPITARVVANTQRVLEWLGRHHVRATFFALGKVCERFPELLPTIAAAGHEIASHGYGHELVFRLTPERFREDLRRSIAVIEDQIGLRPIGYRAPAFSITARTPWAAPILAEMGFRYSSSVFPIRHPRYGIPDAPRFPYRWDTCDLMEFPITTLCVRNRRWPCVGGGYTRLLPAGVMRRAIRDAGALGQPAVVYMHPYEFAPGEVADFQSEGIAVPWRRRFTQELWRSRVEARLSRLVSEFRFGPMSQVLGLELTADEPSPEPEVPAELEVAAV